MYTRIPDKEDPSPTESKQTNPNLFFQQASSLGIDIRDEPNEVKHTPNTVIAYRPGSLDELDERLDDLIWILRIEKYRYRLGHRLFLLSLALICFFIARLFYIIQIPIPKEESLEYDILKYNYTNIIVNPSDGRTCMDIYDLTTDDGEGDTYKNYCKLIHEKRPDSLPDFCYSLLIQACPLMAKEMNNCILFMFTLTFFISGMRQLYRLIEYSPYQELYFDIRNYPRDEQVELIALILPPRILPDFINKYLKHQEILETLIEASTQVKEVKKRRSKFFKRTPGFFKLPEELCQLVLSFAEPEFVPTIRLNEVSRATTDLNLV